MLRVLLPILACSITLGLSLAAQAQQVSRTAEPLRGTQKLDLEGDIAFAMIDGIDRFLLREWAEARDKRRAEWQEMTASYATHGEVPEIKERRHQLVKMLGAQEPRVPITDVTQVHLHFIASSAECDVYAASWPVLRGVRGEGLLLGPATTRGAKADDPEHFAAKEFRRALADGTLPTLNQVVIALPDADQTPESLVGLLPGVPPESQFPRHLAAGGNYVLVVSLIDRQMEKRNGRSELSTREFLYRPGFELGRHLLGYEMQRVRAGIDWVEKLMTSEGTNLQVTVAGYGEGGLLSLLTGAVDTRVSTTIVSGYFGSHPQQWAEPIDRNVFNLWNHFGNAELGVLALDSRAPAKLVIEVSHGPDVALSGAAGGAPSHLRSPTVAEFEEEFAALKSYRKPVTSSFVSSISITGKYGEFIDPNVKPQAAKFKPHDAEITAARVAARKRRQENQIEEDTQKLLVESPYVRAEFMNKIDTSSVEKYAESIKTYRNYFANHVIGRFDLPLQNANPRTRHVYDEEKWSGYEVVLDVYPDVIAYGLLLVPKDIKPGERRPVVVCQHGLEGRPQDLIGEQGKQAYSAFAAKLAERGYVTFAPQNLYLGHDRFRTLQRKANPLGKTLFSIIVPQHQQIVNWLSEQSFVDKDRIAFYGLSYGGKSAMRIPPLVPQYSAVICSADFNDWVWKNASTRSPYSYVWTNEYEIFEWNLGSTFNYAEMSALICPRPFMVERGHFDGVASDEAVAYEFAKVRHLYSARLKLPGLCEMEVFDGPHKINGVGTFEFLDRHLKHSP